MRWVKIFARFWADSAQLDFYTDCAAKCFIQMPQQGESALASSCVKEGTDCIMHLLFRHQSPSRPREGHRVCTYYW